MDRNTPIMCCKIPCGLTVSCKCLCLDVVQFSAAPMDNVSGQRSHMQGYLRMSAQTMWTHTCCKSACKMLCLVVGDDKTRRHDIVYRPIVPAGGLLPRILFWCPHPFLLANAHQRMHAQHPRETQKQGWLINASATPAGRECQLALVLAQCGSEDQARAAYSCQ